VRIRLVHVVKAFRSARGSVTAAKDIHFEVEDREFFVLLGPSGCGKSTVLNLIAGLDKLSGGEIWFDDELVASGEQGVHLAPRERNVAMVFQSYALYPHLSAFENIAFPLRIAGESKDFVSQAVARVASMLGISNLLGAKPGEMSGGQRQRVAIGRAIVRQPSVFLLDEPLSNLDALLRASTRAELKKLQRSLGITTVYVTHDQVEAMSLGDRVALLKDGRLEQLGTPEDLFERPANAFVAKFIGSPPTNILKVSLVKEAGGAWLVIGGARFELPKNRAKPLEEAGQTEYLLGIRPENVYRAGRESGTTLSCKISQVEPLGRETLVHATLDGEEITFLAGAPHEIEAGAGDSVKLAFDLSKAHFFRIGGKQENLFSKIDQ
jgi:multiple sugar transport system ATP-binding protein